MRDPLEKIVEPTSFAQRLTAYQTQAKQARACANFYNNQPLIKLHNELMREITTAIASSSEVQNFLKTILPARLANMELYCPAGSIRLVFGDESSGEWEPTPPFSDDQRRELSNLIKRILGVGVDYNFSPRNFEDGEEY